MSAGVAISRAGGILDRMDGFVLRLLGPGSLAAGMGPPRASRLVLTMLVAGPLYGAVMGSYGLVSEERWLMVLYAAVKMPLLMLATGGLCLPGFFVLTTVLGLREDLGRSLRAILGGQAALVVVLASLAPVTRLVYTSGIGHPRAVLFNALMFALATALAQLVLWRAYRGLIHKDRRHLLMLWGWLLLYAFVGIQMGWMLRPFIGAPDQPVTFFRAEPFSNAYVVIAQLLTGSHG